MQVEKAPASSAPGDVLEAQPIVRLRGVVKRFGEREAVAGLDLDVLPGECFGLLGPNGAGKTTTLRMTYGVAKPTSGRVEVFGIDVTRNPRAVRSRLGVTMQESVFIDVLSAEDNLRVFGRYHLMSEAQLDVRIEQLLDLLELRSHAGVPVKELSGGYQRRVAVAMSLVNSPELLILDEPTTGLDPAVRIALWARVKRLRENGTTVLLTTHYMEEAQRLCDRVAVMAEGRVLAQGSPAELVAKYLAPEALEIECEGSEALELLGALPDASHHLLAGHRLILFADDVRPWVQALAEHDGGDRRPRIVRPAHLEDVFLRLTGTALEGAA